jgi:hypothetical protein
MNNKKKKIIVTSIAAALILSYPYKHKYKKNYNILDEDGGAFASYSDGLIYIGNRDYLLSLDNINEGDILVEDQRYFEDPNMVIYNSCDIVDKDIRNDILEVLCEYEERYPTDWDRSIESMRLEWLCHNMAYCFNYRTDDSCEVDLNNSDEEKYDKKVLSRILRL